MLSKFYLRLTGSEYIILLGAMTQAVNCHRAKGDCSDDLLELYKKLMKSPSSKSFKIEGQVGKKAELFPVVLKDAAVKLLVMEAVEDYVRMPGHSVERAADARRLLEKVKRAPDKNLRAVPPKDCGEMSIA